MRRLWWGAGFGCIAWPPVLMLWLLFMLTLAVSPWVWIPDLWDADGDIVAQTSGPGDNRFYVVQSWGADFYCTLFVHKPSEHEAYWYVVDPDGWKSYGGACKLRQKEGSPVVTVYMRGTLMGSYDYEKRDFTDYRGVSWPVLEPVVEELPRTPEELP